MSSNLHRFRQGPRAARGITLIELLTVIVVIALLATLAVPSYRSYLLRAQRTEAKTALLQLQAAQEKYYLQHHTYTDEIEKAPPDGLGLSATTESGFYEIKVELDDDGQGYTATATPRPGGGQADDTKCTSLSITDTGKRDATGPGGVDYCWR